MLSICLGTLVKYPILPLALATGTVWLVFTIKNRKRLLPIKIKEPKLIATGLILLVMIAGNLGIYGVNLIKYQSVTPDCRDLLSEEQCEISPFVKRFNEIGLDHKLTTEESVQRGYPNPLEYVVDNWIPNMLYRVYGILSTISYFPPHIIIFYRLLFFWMILLAFRYIKQPSFTILSMAGIFLFYSMVLLYINYNSELTYGFKNIAMQGRYIFPVIGAVYVLIGYTLAAVSNKAMQIITLISTVLIFFAGGPIKFITLYNTIFKDYFIH